MSARTTCGILGCRLHPAPVAAATVIEPGKVPRPEDMAIEDEDTKTCSTCKQVHPGASCSASCPCGVPQQATAPCPGCVAREHMIKAQAARVTELRGLLAHATAQLAAPPAVAPVFHLSTRDDTTMHDGPLETCRRGCWVKWRP